MVQCLPGCVLSPLFFNIFFAAAIIVVLQRFSDLVYLYDAPKGEDDRPREDGMFEIINNGSASVVGNAMMYADDAGAVSTSSRGLARMMDVVAVACQEFGLLLLRRSRCLQIFL